LEQACVRSECSSVGWWARGPTTQQMNIPNGHMLVPTPIRPQAPYVCKRDLVPPYLDLQ